MKTLDLISARLLHFKGLEIQVKVIVRTGETPPSVPPPTGAAIVSSQSFGPDQSEVLTHLKHESLGS